MDAYEIMRSLSAAGPVWSKWLAALLRKLTRTRQH